MTAAIVVWNTMNLERATQVRTYMGKPVDGKLL